MWPILKRAGMFCCFLAVLSVGAKQQHCSFFAGLEEKRRVGRRVGWEAEGELERPKVSDCGDKDLKEPRLASGMGPGTLPF